MLSIFYRCADRQIALSLPHHAVVGRVDQTTGKAGKCAENRKKKFAKR